MKLKKSHSIIIYVVILLLVLVGLSVGAYYLFWHNKSGGGKTKVAKATFVNTNTDFTYFKNEVVDVVSMTDDKYEVKNKNFHFVAVRHPKTMNTFNTKINYKNQTLTSCDDNLRSIIHKTKNGFQTDKNGMDCDDNDPNNPLRKLVLTVEIN